MNNTTITTQCTSGQGKVEHIDLTTIIVEANVRTEASFGAEFVASIRQNRVLTPILDAVTSRAASR